MTDAEVFQFADTVRGLQRIFPKRLDEHEQRHLERDYFKALRRFTLSQVQAGAESWLQRGKYFPKPAEWIDAIPRRSAPAADRPTMSDTEAHAYHRAEALRYEDTPCPCADCQAAGVTDKPLRFVPEFTPEDQDRKVRDPIRDRIVTAGHWAHGDELARWYKARADFYDAFITRFGGRPGI